MDPQLLTPWQRRVLANALVALALAFFVLLASGTLWLLAALLIRLQAVLIPLALGALLAYLQMPLVDWLHEKRGWSRLRATWLVFGAGLVLFIGLSALVLPAIIQELTDLAQKLPPYFRKAANRAAAIVEQAHQLSVPPAWQSTVDTTINNAMASLPDLTKGLTDKLIHVLSSAASWFSAIIGFLILPLYIFYFLKDPDVFAVNWKLYVPVAEARIREDIIRLVQEINNELKAFFRGQCIVAACVGALAAIGFYIAGIDFALLLGIWVGAFDLIPFFGVIAGALPATLIAYAQYSDWQHPLAAGAVCVGVHLVENLLLAPKIVGNKTGLHPVVVVLSILIWGKLLGFFGILLAVPLTSTLKVLFRHYLWQRLPART
jgi:predicted PurR-regulated permease PerM